MNGRTRFLERVVIVAGVALALLVMSGCTKEEPTPTEKAAQTQAKDLSTVAKETATAAKDQAVAAKDQVAAAIEQKTCPVMDGNPIDQNIFVEYKGKKVYFCCADCKAKFLANPEQYLAKLPQFQN
jgi:YHS domain-containing protein